MVLSLEQDRAAVEISLNADMLTPGVTMHATTFLVFLNVLHFGSLRIIVASKDTARKKFRNIRVI